MTETSTTPPGRQTSWLDRLAADRPDIILIAPMLVYLALLGLRDTSLIPFEYRWVASLLRGVGGLVVVWILRRHLPPWGRPYWALAALMGLLIAAGWYYGQLLCDALGLPHRLPLFPGQFDLQAHAEKFDALRQTAAFWPMVITRIAVASVTVPIVEELFWRAFLLRALIRWDSFEKIPLGTFTLRSFLLTSLLSVLEHPDNWIVSIPCWFAFNGLMYWKKSLLFLVLVHGFTNLFLYLWVIYQAVALHNPAAWMFW